MARLVVNPGTPSAWEIELKPGTNLLGRGFANDFKIDDPSVSGSHCQIIVQGDSAFIKDLGSTNGTFVDRAPVREAELQAGQIVHLGGVEMLFQTALSPVATASHVPPAFEEPPPLPLQAIDVPVSGTEFCKSHPKTLARYFCNKCGHAFCELCVTSRAGHKFCRHCGAECATLQVQTARRPGTKGFFARLPGALAYPVRGSGLLVLIVATLIFAALRFGANMFGGGFLSVRSIVRLYELRAGLPWSWWGLMVQVFVLGYLFSYMQTIIHSTAVGDNEMPALPTMANFWEDVLLPCLQLLALTLICFLPAIVVGWLLISSDDPGSLAKLFIATLAFGGVYFPMAFLAVAMLDSVVAANPLQVLPSIAKVPLEYLVTVILLGAVLVLRGLGDTLLPMLFPRGLTTHSVSKMLAMFGAQAFWSLASLYLLTLAMHILGLLYVTKKERLGWLSH